MITPHAIIHEQQDVLYDTFTITANEPIERWRVTVLERDGKRWHVAFSGMVNPESEIQLPRSSEWAIRQQVQFVQAWTATVTENCGLTVDVVN